MPDLVRDIIKFRGDRLFNGAVNIDWFHNDSIRTEAAASAFVFHGPSYHGVSQADIGVAHGHRLQDTASFARSIVRRCYGIEDQPFTLAIAGYGTGKSHFGLTLSTLLNQPAGNRAEAILSGIDNADQAIGSEIRAILSEARQPCLVVAINGMNNFDLTTEITRQIISQVKAFDLDTRPLDNLRPRFAQAASLIRMAESNTELITELLTACETASIDNILEKLEKQDDVVYGIVHRLLATKNIKISALGGESIRDIIDVATREYCGAGKMFKCLVVLFDEFGRFTEFATERSHIAGSGVLQDLFEGIQASSGLACFAGFIQFELNAYVQRVAPEHRNEILRYVTRYQAANRVYLSINLETLVANLIEKKKPLRLKTWFDNDTAKKESQTIAHDIVKWFPQSRNHRLWSDTNQFHSVIREGCWPLSPYSTWLLFHLAAAGKHLQERSALALLGDAIDRFKEYPINEDGLWELSPADLWSEGLQNEFITSEEGGQQGSITHAYASVCARYGSRLEGELLKLLRAVVIASKMGAKAANRDEAIQTLSALSGMHSNRAEKRIELLQNEYNVLEWIEAFKSFDILGDAVPRTQFLAFLRQRIGGTYDEAGKASLFASKATNWCDLLNDLECDFAEENKITTREWRYQGITSNLNLLPMQVKLASDRWSASFGVDEPRGTIIYCYVEPSRQLNDVTTKVSRMLRQAAKEHGLSALPILVVLLCDEEGTLGKSIAELAVLDDSISEEDRVRFGNLIPAHQERTREVMRSAVEEMIKERHYITGFTEPLAARRLIRAGTELFTRIYNKPVSFPFDGFSTAKGNAADSCQDLISELLLGKLDWNAVMGKPIRVKNRAVTVLKDSWGIFAKNGYVRTRPGLPVLRVFTERCDELLTVGKKRIIIADELRRLCLPPYGANLASAGLFLGVFFAPRVDKLNIIRTGQSYSIPQWVADGIFRGKFIDIKNLNEVEIIHIGEESSEWEILLDEWEQVESHSGKIACFKRANNLNARIPVPPALAFRQIRLEEQSQNSYAALKEIEKQQDEALSKIDSGMNRGDISLLAWGASELLNIAQRMTNEKPLWTDHQINEAMPAYERTRQVIIQYFSDWIERQSPRSATPDVVGDFKHKMIRLTGGNLKKLGLDDLYQQLETYIANIIKNVETTAEAHELIREVELWLSSHGNPARLVRVAELRDLQQVGKTYVSKLQGLSKRIQMPKIGEARIALSNTLDQMKKLEKSILTRASVLWETKIQHLEDIERLLTEVESLFAVFENCTRDLEDLQLMRNALRIYKKDYQKLDDDKLDWIEFQNLYNDTTLEAINELSEHEVPWNPEVVLKKLFSNITKQRKEKSARWIESLSKEASEIKVMPAFEANRLLAKANNPPAFITEEDTKKLNKFIKMIESRLDEINIDWLVEKFKQLSPSMREKFLSVISEWTKN